MKTKQTFTKFAAVFAALLAASSVNVGAACVRRVCIPTRSTRVICASRMTYDDIMRFLESCPDYRALYGANETPSVTPQMPVTPETPSVPDIPEPPAEQPQTPTVPETPAETPAVPETPDTSDFAAEQEIVSLVNAERAKYGLNGVTLDTALCKAASVRAGEIVRSFSHTRPNGNTCFSVLGELGITYRGAGENIAYGQPTAREVMTAWMNSEGHRANILNASFTRLGVGIVKNGSTMYWAQMFAY